MSDPLAFQNGRLKHNPVLVDSPLHRLLSILAKLVARRLVKKDASKAGPDSLAAFNANKEGKSAGDS
jgi:hypothetical protein